MLLSARLYVNTNRARKVTSASSIAHPLHFRLEWLNAAESPGFFQPDSGGKEVFVHIGERIVQALTELKEELYVRRGKATPLSRNKFSSTGIVDPG